MTENIDTALLAIYGEVGYVQKKGKGGLNYTFAGEAALIEAVRPQMVKAGVTMRVTEILDVRHEAYQTTKGSSMNRVTLTAVVRFTHAESQTWVDCQARGEGADVGDKASAKALTGAFKYALRETFCIETGDDPDNHPSEEQERAPERGPELGDAPTCENPDCNLLCNWRHNKPNAAKLYKAWVCPKWVSGSKDHSFIFVNEDATPAPEEER